MKKCFAATLSFLVPASAAIAVGAGVFVFFQVGRERHFNLPPLGQVPAYLLTNQDGNPFASQDLKGKVALYNFIFTRCPSVCPLLTARMKELQERTLGLPNVRLVSISVDPANDLPPVLKKYADSHGADKKRWVFLTGEPKQIENLVVRGFMSAMGPRSQGDKDTNSKIFDMVHGEHFVVVDGAGAIRAFRRVSSESDLSDVERVLVQIAREVVVSGTVAAGN